MKHFFTYSIITIQNFALFIFSILAIIFYNCFNLGFYKNFYEKENLASSINTTNSELINNTENLRYFRLTAFGTPENTREAMRRLKVFYNSK